MSTDKYPPRAVVTCMDFRVKEDVILRNMRWHQQVGEIPPGAYFIRNAGGAVTQDVIRSLMLLQKFVLKKNDPNGVYDIQILVVAHTHCGMKADGEDAMNKEIENDFWICEKAPFALETFPSPELSVRRSIQRLVTSRWVTRRDPQGRPLQIWGQLYAVEDERLPDGRELKKDKIYAVGYHIVQERQDWQAVAGIHGITAEALKKANPQAIRSDNYLGTGQVLYIPPKQ